MSRIENKDERVLVAIGEPVANAGARTPTMILGIPEGAWEYMKDGLTHTVDLAGCGINVQVMIYRGKDHADCVRRLSDAGEASGAPLRGRANVDRDVGIKDPTVQ